MQYFDVLTELNQVETPLENPINSSKEALDRIQLELSILKEKVSTLGFPSDNDEIEFFKYTLPKAYSLFLHHTRVIKFESTLPPGTTNALNSIDLKTKKIAAYFRQHEDWVIYIRTDSTNLDSTHFLRQNNHQLLTQYSPFIIDPTFATSGTYPVAMILSLELTQNYLEHRKSHIEATRLNPSAHKQSSKRHDLRWTGSKSDLIELLYALYSNNTQNKIFNSNNYISIRQIADWLESSLQVDLGNYYRVLQGIRIRHNRTKYMNEITDDLIRYMDQTDENPKIIF